MTSFRPFTSFDLLKYNLVNTDVLTETYGLSFYLSYLANWPEYFVCAETLNREISGYVMGKSEGKSNLFHGHVTAVTVAPPFRRQKLANKLMETLERVTETFHSEAYFIDLFVRESNENAIQMYRKMGYSAYRRVLGYYAGPSPSSNTDDINDETKNKGKKKGPILGEDALDMRKSTKRDVQKVSVIPARRFEQHPWEIEWH
jgi:N-terminal acetyltransferase B complex catalytic subunit|tara:strand:+ start:338 stop:943 length:606 start_codon:yes stop_codon:yes gene_type:complete